VAEPHDRLAELLLPYVGFLDTFFGRPESSPLDCLWCQGEVRIDQLSIKTPGQRGDARKRRHAVWHHQRHAISPGPYGQQTVGL
jgi:hypothetical protein